MCATQLLGSLRETYASRGSSGEGSYGAIAGVELEASRYDKYTYRGHKRSSDGANGADCADAAAGASREDPLGAATHTLGPYSVRWATLAFASGNDYRTSLWWTRPRFTIKRK